MTNLPSITILTGTYNSHLPTFKRVLDSVKFQTYPKSLIEHVVSDKKSTNGCVALAKKYGCHVIVRQEPLEREQIAAADGILQARGDLILLLESDNILTSKDWLRRMVQPLIENKKIVATFSMYNACKKNMTAITRYSALMGTIDPTLYYMQKSEKMPQFEQRYTLGTIVAETANYYEVKFDKHTLPTLGDNGHMFRKTAIKKVIKDPSAYTHTDAFMDMLSIGYNRFGVVKNSIIHIMNPNIFQGIKRRVEVKERFYDGRRGKRKYLVVNWKSPEERLRLTRYVLLSITFVVPFIHSLKGYRKVRDLAWFLHPFMCFMMVIAYGQSEIRYLVVNRFKKSKKIATGHL